MRTLKIQSRKLRGEKTTNRPIPKISYLILQTFWEWWVTGLRWPIFCPCLVQLAFMRLKIDEHVDRYLTSLLFFSFLSSAFSKRSCRLFSDHSTRNQFQLRQKMSRTGKKQRPCLNRSASHCFLRSFAKTTSAKIGKLSRKGEESMKWPAATDDNDYYLITQEGLSLLVDDAPLIVNYDVGFISAREFVSGGDILDGTTCLFNRNNLEDRRR